MPCYHPLHAYKDKHEDPYKIKITFKRSNSWRGEKIDLPCGQCIGCRLEKARQWAVRCMHEAQCHENNCFVTLTYDDRHLPGNKSLQLKDFQLFMKRLRKKFGSGIRFFHCGEYGEELGRPHYHALLFNIDFEDKKAFSQSNGFKTYTSEILSSLWDKGFAVIGDLTFESAGYVARYSLKKVTGQKAEAHYNGKKAEYATMSRRPGIGKKWYEKYKGEVYPLDRVNIRGFDSKPPRYYDGLLQKEDPSTMMLLKIKREESAGKKFVEDYLSNGKKVVESDMSDRRLQDKETTKLSQIKMLSRHKEDGL